MADKQLFADVADELLAFVGDAPLLLSPNCGRIVEQSPQEIFVFVALNQSSAVRTRMDCSKPPIFRARTHKIANGDRLLADRAAQLVEVRRPYRLFVESAAARLITNRVALMTRSG